MRIFQVGNMISRSVTVECKWCLKYKGHKSLNVMQSEGDCKGRLRKYNGRP